MNGFGKLPQPNFRTLRNDRNILHPKRRAILGDDDRLCNVLGPVHQSDGAHVDLLQTFLYETAACVGIVVRELLLDLRQTQAVSDQFVWINAHLVFARGSAEAGNVDNIRHGFEILFDDPVFQGLQFHGVICGIGAPQREEINLPDWAPVRAHLRHHAWRQRDLAQPLQNPLPVPIVVRLVIKDQLQIGESEQRERAQMHHVRDAVHDDFEWNRDLLFNLLRRNSRPLRNHLNVVVRHVGVGLNRKITESDDAPGKSISANASTSNRLLRAKSTTLRIIYCSTVFCSWRAFETT